MSIYGFDVDPSDDDRRRAHEALSREAERLAQRRAELVIADDLVEFEGLTPTMVVALGESGVRTLDDLADLAGAELRYIVSPGAEVKSLDAIAELDEERLESVRAGSPPGADETTEMIMRAPGPGVGAAAPDGKPEGNTEGVPDRI